MPTDDLEQLAASASDLEPVRPPTPVANGWGWRLLDRLGPFLPYGAALFTAIPLVLNWLGGQDYAWAGNFYYLVVICLVAFIPYLFRRRQQERAAEYLRSQQSQGQARREVARLVLENSQQKGTGDSGQGPEQTG